MSKIPVLLPLRVTDHDVAEPVRPDDLANLSAPLTSMLTSELDEAQRYLEVTPGELILAALSGAIARAIGDGEVRVDVYGHDRPISLSCMTARQADATGMLRAVHRTLAAPQASGGALPRADVFFSYIGTVAEPSLVDLAPAEMLSGRGYALALRVYRSGGQLQMDWWHDARRLDESTVEELTEQFPLALIELTSEAIPPIYKDAHMVMA
jgi:hypothetical protein